MKLPGAGAGTGAGAGAATGFGAAGFDIMITKKSVSVNPFSATVSVSFNTLPPCISFCLSVGYSSYNVAIFSFKFRTVSVPSASM